MISRKVTIFFANLLWIHFLFSLFNTRIHFFLFREFTFKNVVLEIGLNQRSLSRIHFESTISFVNFRQIHFWSFPNSLWIRYLFREYTSIHYFFREFTIYSLSFRQIHYLFSGLNLSWFSFWRRNYKFTTCFTNNPWISYIFDEFTLNQLSFSQINYEFSIYFGNSI